MLSGYASYLCVYMPICNAGSYFSKHKWRNATVSSYKHTYIQFPASISKYTSISLFLFLCNQCPGAKIRQSLTWLPCTHWIYGDRPPILLVMVLSDSHMSLPSLLNSLNASWMILDVLSVPPYLQVLTLNSLRRVAVLSAFNFGRC